MIGRSFAKRASTAFALLGMMFLLAGCSGGSTGDANVKGTVTYQNKPLERGYISFLPQDGVGQAKGAPIISGSYKIANIHSGKYKVEVMTDKPAADSGGGGGASYEQYGKQQANEKAMREHRGSAAAKAKDSDEMPAEAGLNLTAFINPGENTQDFPLVKPKAK